jgi:hypothetical protein
MRLFYAIAGVLLGSAMLAQSGVAQTYERELFAQSAAARKYALIITGPTVGAENEAKYRQLTLSLHDVLGRDYGYGSEQIELLYSAPQAASTETDSRVDGVADRQGLRDAVARLKNKMKRGDQLAVFLLGHGTGSDDEAKFNIRGPDVTGTEFAALFSAFTEQDLVFVNTTSASFGFSRALASAVAGEGRIVVSATRSSAEKFDPLFSRYFIEGLSERRADRDKNSRVSLLEAFNYARNNVQSFYDEQGRLAAEHAGLDDNGDAQFTLAPAPGEADGSLSEIAFIDAQSIDELNLTEEQLILKRRMQSLEREVLLLRGRKSEFLEDDYWQRFEELMLSLARTTEEFSHASTAQ